jgi:hypothetical protein
MERELLTSLATRFFNHEFDNPPLQTTIAKLGKVRDDSVDYRGAKWS